jgi:hypothetical protein
MSLDPFGSILATASPSIGGLDEGCFMPAPGSHPPLKWHWRPANVFKDIGQRPMPHRKPPFLDPERVRGCPNGERFNVLTI